MGGFFAFLDDVYYKSCRSLLRKHHQAKTTMRMPFCQSRLRRNSTMWHLLKRRLSPIIIVMQRGAVPGSVTVDVLHLGRFISIAATALAVVKLSAVLQRFLFSIRCTCFSLFRVWYLPRPLEALLLHFCLESWSLDMQLHFSAVSNLSISYNTYK